MDDCNIDEIESILTHTTVQIPLWTIVTIFYYAKDLPEGEVQIPLWTIVTETRLIAGQTFTCSDSSMDDCNNDSPAPPDDAPGFRFLYGRL